jgi:choice-of-anchor B domain-containing protein
MRCIFATLVVLCCLAVATPAAAQNVACEGGTAAGFPCDGIDLLAYVPLADLGGASRANDIWGWTDPETNREYALVGLEDGTAFVDVTDPVAPVYVGTLPLTQNAVPSIWRDVKVYQDHAYVVADNAGGHGMQVFDLTQLRDVSTPPVTFEETARYDGFRSAHNVAINTETGFAYAVGITGPQSGTGCGPGLHMVDLSEPARPEFAGCFSDLQTGGRVASGYVHDTQCVVYEGPDVDYQGREVCFSSSELSIGIADVTDKANAAAIAQATYPNPGYVHQGWLTEDQRYFIQNDETDETGGLVDRTRTLIWDVTDLDEPVLLTEHFGTTGSSDHNLYVEGDLVFQANYRSGLRVLDIGEVQNPIEVAFFDTVPVSDAPGYLGAWSVYPYLPSGTLLVSSIREGLFVLSLQDATVATGGPDAVPEGFTLSPAYPNPFNPTTTFRVTLPAAQPLTVAAYDVLGRRVATLHEGPLPAGVHPFTFDASGLPSGTYVLRAVGATGQQTRTVTLAK